MFVCARNWVAIKIIILFQRNMISDINSPFRDIITGNILFDN